VRPEDVRISGRLATRGNMGSVARLVSIGRMVTVWLVPPVTSATELPRVKAMARQQSGIVERTGRDFPFGAGQQSWLAPG